MNIIYACILGVAMGVGGYALMQATLHDREADAAQDAQMEHCQQVNALVIAEFDAIIARGKFPSQDQQDRWRQLTRECGEERKGGHGQ